MEYISYEENDYKKYKYLDEIFMSFIEGYEYESYHIPGMIDESTLVKCGYINSFPHQLTIPARVKDSDVENVMQNQQVNSSNLKAERMYLSPAACLHFYPLLEGKDIKQKILTTLTQVYRYEREGFGSADRLWEFNVREMVFVGNIKYVEDMLGLVLKKALAFAHEIDERAFVKVANDYFYPGRKNEMKCLIQKKNKLKQELIMHIGDKEAAVASFNSHVNHFSKPFRFEGDGTVVSGCVGFGMERWMLACKEIGLDDLKSRNRWG